MYNAITQFENNYKIFFSFIEQESKDVFFDRAQYQILNIVLMYYLLFDARLKIFIYYKEN